MKRTLCALLVLSSSASAALIPRLGGQAVYDTDINVTWLADANLAATNSFGVSGISDGTNDDLPAGRMHEQTALDWLEAMNAAYYLGADDWRNADGSDHIGDFCFPAVFVQPACTGSELGHMYYNVLGAEPAHMLPDGSVAFSDERGDHPPFKNIQLGYLYGLFFGSPHSYSFVTGYHDDFGGAAYIWAVRDGDIGAPGWTEGMISEPAMPTLLALALGAAWLGLALSRRPSPPRPR